MQKSRQILMFGIMFVVAVTLIIIGLTYAFFKVSLTGNEEAENTVLTTATLRLVFIDTDAINLDNAFPGSSKTKTFTVENIGTGRQKFDINITDVVNTFINEDLIYTITSDNESGGEALNQVMPSTESTLLTSSIDPEVKITYTITVKFKETGSNQNENMGAVFSGKLKIVPKVMGVAMGGYIYDENDNALPNVTVELHSDPISTITDETGYYELKDVSVGIHTLYIKQGETVLGSKQVTFLLNEQATLEDNEILKLPEEPNNYVNIKLGNDLIISLKSKVLNVKDKILKDNIAEGDSSLDFSKVLGEGLYYTADTQYGEDDERIYYYRGAVNNNWLSFGGYLWRIVRTTSEGGVKLAYSGDGISENSAFISTSTAFNTSSNNKYYVGYTYNTSEYSGVQTNSIIKGIVDTWYNTNLNSYSSYLSDTAVYCNDRSSERVDGSNIRFASYDRIWTNKRPTYSCPSTNGSRYTASISTGNKYLSYPIALLTGDEASYAGLVRNGSGNSNSYIMENAKSKHWWTMTPASFTTYGINWMVHTDGNLYPYNGVGADGAVRPSVSLKSCITVSEGEGTNTNPYIIKNDEC